MLANETYAEAGTLAEDDGFVPLLPDDKESGLAVERSTEPTNRAGPQPTHYRLNGRKDLINGGRHHELLVFFARTRAKKHQSMNNTQQRTQSDFSLFLLNRDEWGEAITSPLAHLAHPSG